MEVEDASAATEGTPAPALRVVPDASFEDVYADHYARMVRVAHMLTGSNEAAEDVVHDAFVALYRRFDAVSDPPGYLYRTVVNGCRARRRHRRVMERVRPVARTVDPEMSEIDETWAALAALAPRRRAAVVLRFYADLSLAEIAEVMGWTTGTVKSTLHRALADLKEVIAR